MTDGSDNDTPDYNHFKLLEEDYQAGTLHPAFHNIYHELAAKYKRVSYNPPTHLVPTWTAWRELRRTKNPREMIDYRDINAYFEVMDMRLSPHYVRLLLEYDYKFAVTFRDIQEDMENRPNPNNRRPVDGTSEQ